MGSNKELCLKIQGVQSSYEDAIDLSIFHEGRLIFPIFVVKLHISTEFLDQLELCMLCEIEDSIESAICNLDTTSEKE